MTKKIKTILIIGTILFVGFIIIWNLFISTEELPAKTETQPLGDLLDNEPDYNNSIDGFSDSQGEINFLSGFNNKQLEITLERYFVNQEQFSWETVEDSWRLCTVKNLEEDKELFPFSVWVYCGEYIIQDGNLHQLSGSSGPVKIDYPNELSYYSPGQFTHRRPRDGDYYSEDIKSIFSNEVQKSIDGIDVDAVMKANLFFVLDNYLAWENIKQAISECKVEQVFQAHSLHIEAILEDGTKLAAIEPKIDEIFNLITSADCKDVIMATE